VVCAGKDGISFINVRTLKEIARIGNQGEVLALALSPDGRRLAWARRDGIVRIEGVARLLARYKVRKKREE
jgi:hypothetical protein